MLSINIDVLEVLIISRIDNCPTHYGVLKYNLDNMVCHGVDKDMYISYHDVHNDNRFLK
jgi:hypothetical protein